MTKAFDHIGESKIGIGINDLHLLALCIYAILLFVIN